MAAARRVSDIRTAQYATRCDHCHQPIQPGQDYLRFAAGLTNRLHICMPCAGQKHTAYAHTDAMRRRLDGRYT